MTEPKAVTQHNGRAVMEASSAPPLAPALPDEEGPDFRRALSAARRHATLLIAVVAVGVAGSVVASRHWKPMYRSSTTIWIASQTEAQGRNGQQLGPIRQDMLLQWESWVDLLKSFAILDPVVRDLSLNITPSSSADSLLFRSFASNADVRADDYTLQISRDGAYTLKGRNKEPLARGALGDSIAPRLGFLWSPPRDSAFFGRTVRFEVVTPRTASERLAKALDARVDRNGAFLKVDLTSQSPARAALVLNAVATRYVQVASELKKRRLAEFSRNLEQQRSESQDNLNKVERDLEKFRIKSVGLPRSADAAPVAGGAAVAAADPVVVDEGELDRVRRDRAAISHWLSATPESRSPGGPLLSEGVGGQDLHAALEELTRKRADLRTLRYRYEDSYSAVQLLNEDIKQLSEGTIPGIVKQLDADLASREHDLANRVASRNDELRALPPRMLEEARLTRAATEAANLNATVQQRYQEARLAQASSLPDVWVLDAAESPQLPVSDQSRRVLLLGAASSVGLAFLLVLFLDRIDPRVRYPAEVSRQMGLTILGAVPHLKARRENGAITPAAAEEVTEALRGIRLSLTYAGSAIQPAQAGIPAKPLMLTISSSGPGDGKSFITSNLGLSFALAGYRTLVIDGDLRRGTLHRAYGAERKPGLTECLRGEITPHNVVQRTSFAHLGIIGSGARDRLAPELLGGPKMKTLIETLTPDFDVILCDSPPLSAGVDPYLLATLTGQMMIVLRTGVSVRSVLAAKLAVLEQMPVHVVGAVLNAVPTGDLYRPYSYYVEGYSAEDELEPSMSLPRA